MMIFLRVGKRILLMLMIMLCTTYAGHAQDYYIFNEMVGEYDIHAKVGPEEYLNYRRLKSPARWNVDPIALQPGNKISTDAKADSICAHYLRDDISPHPYVKGAVFMGEDFDWLHNPRKPTDPAFTDEWTWIVVGRMKFLEHLVQAYQHTNNEKYGKKALWFLQDFLEQHPLQSDYSESDSSTKLWRTLEVAIRVTSIMNTYFALRDAPFFTASDQMIVSTLAYQHAHRLKGMLLSRPDRTGNHVTTESYALYVVGALFPEFKDAENWRKIAVERYIREIDRVVPPDGLQAELSPSYHYGVVASYHNLYDIATLNNFPLPEGFIEKLQLMYRAPVLIMDQTGDFVRTNDSNPRNIRALSKKGLSLGYDPLLAWAASDGKEGIAPATSTVLPYAGFYAMRSGWKKEDQFLFFRGGPQGIGHAEQDMLQVVMKAYGKSLLFDPGKYNYDQSEWRRFAINTSSHNTIIVDGKWQYRKKQIPKTYLPVDNTWVTTPLFDYVSATYDSGYVTNEYDPSKQYRPERWMDDRDTSVRHTRHVLYLKPFYALILDQLDGTGYHTYDAHFHLNANSATIDTVANAVYSKSEDDAQIALFALETENLTTELIQGQKDPMLGWMPSEHRPIPTARYRKQQDTPAIFATILYPFLENKEYPDINVSDINLTRTETVWAKNIRTSKEDLSVLVSKTGKSQLFSFRKHSIGKVMCNAEGMVFRKKIGLVDEATYIGGWQLSFYQSKKITFKVSKATDIVFSHQGGVLLMLNSGEDPVEVDLTRPFKKRVILQPKQWLQLTKQEIINIDTPLN